MQPEQELRELRRSTLRQLIAESRIGQQTALVEALRARGIEATQSSVSRDLQELGITKVGGRYVLPAGDPATVGESLKRVARFLRSVRPAGPHLTVVQTMAGGAQSLAAVIDQALWPEVVGTVAGDDTLFIATASAGEQRTLLARLEHLLKEATG